MLSVEEGDLLIDSGEKHVGVPRRTTIIDEKHYDRVVDSTELCLGVHCPQFGQFANGVHKTVL